jgi:hypothetical protein
MPFPSDAVRRSIKSVIPASVALTCSVCHSQVRIGELICLNCNTPLVSIGKTQTLDIPDTIIPRIQPKDEAFVQQGTLLFFEIDGQFLRIPTLDYLLVGRVSRLYGQEPPDIDLSPFHAEKHGVSRLHLRVTRTDTRIFVTDIGSTNGTYANGHRLAPYAEWVLHNGDELQLGSLRLGIRLEQ